MENSADRSSCPQRVIFSRRAHAAIVAETLEQHPNETGGILLGHRSYDTWQVIEAIDPGPAARFSAVTFEYDTAYVNHLARKVAGYYITPLKLIGLWHRHPGSSDRFSPEDDITNRRYAEQCTDGALSCLVNVDPIFRITAYHVPASLDYCQLPHICSDAEMNGDLLQLKSSSCLGPEALEIRCQQQVLHALLAGDDESAVDGVDGELKPELGIATEQLLELLEGQQRFAFGLKRWGSQIRLALVERFGPAQFCFLLRAGESNRVLIQSESHGAAVPFDIGRFWQMLQEPLHG